MERQSYRLPVDGDTLFLIAIAFAMVLEVNLLGRLLLADLICIAALPFLFAMRGKMLLRGTLAKILVFGLLWLVAQIVTDVIRGTPVEDYTRGWAKIIVFLMNLSTIAMLIRNDVRKAMVFVIAIAIAGALRLFLGLGDFALIRDSITTSWKFGYGNLVSILAFALTGILARKARGSGALDTVPLGAAAVAFLFNARSMFAFTAASAIIQLFARSHRRIKTGVLIVYAAIIAAVLGGLIVLYSYAASTGALGEDSRAKYEAQAAGQLGLLGGRPEYLASTQAIIDSPIIGHGSWAKDIHYIDLMVARMAEFGLEINGDFYALPLIPTHSHILGCWVEGGIVGGLFWVYIFWLALSAFIAILRRPPPEIGLLSFVLIGFLWDILFSPFGLERRVVNAALICLVLAILKQANVQRAAARAERDPVVVSMAPAGAAS